MSPIKAQFRQKNALNRNHRDYNPGVRLYLKGLKKQEEKIRLSEYAKQVKEQQEE